MLSNEKVLFIGDGSGWSFLAATQLRRVYKNVQTIFWDHSKTPPSKHLSWKGDRVFTFKADLVLPPGTIENAAKSAINFHPSTPDYRGVGGYHFALADQRPEFGATCHYIDEKIDHGGIIAVDRFPIFSGEDADSLTDRTAHACLGLFYRVVQSLGDGSPLPVTSERWGTKLYTRQKLSKFLKGSEARRQLKFA